MLVPSLLAAISAVAFQTPAPPAPVTPTPAPVYMESKAGLVDWNCDANGGLDRFRSDRAFPKFIGPISNPVLAKDPRSLTEIRGLFIGNSIPAEHPLGDGDFQVYAAQIRVALSERLTFIADKDGYANINPGGGGPSQNGWLNLAAGLKYTFIRDVENQFLVAGGFMYEAQTGSADVFQSHGDGLVTLFATLGKEVCCDGHFLANIGYQLPVDSSANSSMFYTSLHLDYRLFDFLYPLVELNWYRWTAGGDRGLPPALGEGDGLLNLGTSGVAGNNLVTVALGMKAMLSECMEVGFAWEKPVSDRKDLIDNRLLVELILRY